jgi:hypothetical protein
MGSYLDNYTNDGKFHKIGIGNEKFQ